MKDMELIDIKKIKDLVYWKNFLSRFFVLLFGVTLLALNYNLFLVPNSLVIGGTSGLAIIFQKLWGLNPQIFLYIASIILIIISFIFLGKEETMKSIIGSILYPIMVSVTLPIAEYLKNYVTFDSFLVIVLLAGLISGLSNGIVYKTGFTTGGSDILMKIINKYARIPEGKSVLYTNIVIILAGGFIFGINKMIYAIIVLYISSSLVDRILIGISNSKLFFIYTKETESVKKFIIEDLKSGVTMLDTKGGYRKEKGYLLMCVVPTPDYYYFKESVLAIDPHAFFVINDCYEVHGGVKRSNLPFNS
jgi:uncharacterized membrane-anchored protein YitT (DUF2179 family)